MSDSKLALGSFRGASFRVDTEEYKGGRRAVVHVYPQRDKVYVEDLGRAPSKFTVNGLVGGKTLDEAKAARDKLLETLEKGGSGTLVLPGWPNIEVSVDGEISCSADAKARGAYRFTFTVVKDDGVTYPTSAVNTSIAVETAADGLNTATASDFGSRFSIDGVPDFVASGALDDLSSGLSTVEQAAGRARALIADPIGMLRVDLAGLLSQPFALAARVQSLFQSFGGAVGDEVSVDSSSPLGALAALAAYPSTPLSVPAATPSRVRQADNRGGIESLIRRAAIAQAARQTAAADWATRDDAAAAREAMVSLIDDEAARTESNDVFRALTDLRVKAARDISSRSADSSRLTTITPPEPTPAAVIAYDLWEAAGRESEVVARNRSKVIHPLFVPPQTLTVPAR